MRTGDYDRAIQDYDQSIQLNPANVDAYSSRGQALFYQGNFRAAHTALSHANELQNDAHATVWQYLARERAGEEGAADLATNATRLKK